MHQSRVSIIRPRPAGRRPAKCGGCCKPVNQESCDLRKRRRRAPAGPAWMARGVPLEEKSPLLRGLLLPPEDALRARPGRPLRDVPGEPAGGPGSAATADAPAAPAPLGRPGNRRKRRVTARIRSSPDANGTPYGHEHSRTDGRTLLQVDGSSICPMNGIGPRS